MGAKGILLAEEKEQYLASPPIPFSRLFEP
jgi:hypothetical protein